MTTAHSADRFRVCLAETLRWEGGYSDHPSDPGGPTMAGIIQRVYDAWRDQMGLVRRPVREIERREIEAIYYQQYWCAVRGDDLPPGVDLAVYDFAVNSGPPRALRALQAVLGVTVDGHVGAGTLAAVNAAAPDETVARLMAERRRFIRQIKHYKTFAKGWERRCTGIEAVAAMQCVHEIGVTAEPPTIDVPLPLPDLDAQSAEQGRAPPPSPPASPGFGARAWGWLIAALGLGQVAGDVASGPADPTAALSLIDRIEPVATRLVTTPGGQIMCVCVVVGLAVVIIGRRADVRQILNG